MLQSGRFQGRRNPYASLTAGFGALTVGPIDLVLLRFAWADLDTGQVSNIYDAGDQIGFAIPTYRMWDWNRVYGAAPGNVPTLRSGMGVALAAQGDFFTQFSAGAEVGAQVWANPVTGQANSGDGFGQPVLVLDSNDQVVLDSNGNPLYATGVHFIPTPWTVMQDVDCDGWARISSWVAPLFGMPS